MSRLVLTVAPVITGIITLYLACRIWAVRRKISCMSGMMVAMTVGTLVGLIGGVTTAAVLAETLWHQAVGGIVIGGLVGGALGFPVSLMAVVDGGLAGIMAGLMGAMLGAMAPEDISSILVFLVLVYVLVTLLLATILHKEAGGSFRATPSMWVGGLIVFTFLLAAYRPFSSGPRVDHKMVPGEGAHQGHGQSHNMLPGQRQTDDRSVSPTGLPLEITALDFGFDRRALEIPRGKLIRISLSNKGQAEHDLEAGIPAKVVTPGRHGDGLHLHALPGQTDVLELVALRSGTYEAWCTIPGHRGLGMKMTIRVHD